MWIRCLEPFQQNTAASLMRHSIILMHIIAGQGGSWQTPHHCSQLFSSSVPGRKETSYQGKPPSQTALTESWAGKWQQKELLARWAAGEGGLTLNALLKLLDWDVWYGSDDPSECRHISKRQCAFFLSYICQHTLVHTRTHTIVRVPWFLTPGQIITPVIKCLYWKWQPCSRKNKGKLFSRWFLEKSAVSWKLVTEANAHSC